MNTTNPMTPKQLDAIRGRLDRGTPTTEDVSILLAEVERLRARPAVTEDMVERGALAFYEHPTPGVDVSLTPGWDRLTATSPDVATAYRNRIRAALEAAHNPGMWS